MKWSKEILLFILTWSVMLVGIVVHVYSTFAQINYVHEYVDSRNQTLEVKIDRNYEAIKDLKR